MKATSITMLVTFNTGTYTSVKVGGDFTATDRGFEADAAEAFDTITAAFRQLDISRIKVAQAQPTAPLNAQAMRLAENLNLTQAGNDKHITLRHPKWQAILAKARQGVPLVKMTEQGFTFDEVTAAEVVKANQMFEQIRNI